MFINISIAGYRSAKNIILSTIVVVELEYSSIDHRVCCVKVFFNEICMYFNIRNSFSPIIIELSFYYNWMNETDWSMLGRWMEQKGMQQKMVSRMELCKVNDLKQRNDILNSQDEKRTNNLLMMFYKSSIIWLCTKNINKRATSI